MFLLFARIQEPNIKWYVLGFGSRWSRSLPWLGFWENDEQHYWEFTCWTANFVVFCYTDKVDYCHVNDTKDTTCNYFIFERG